MRPLGTIAIALTLATAAACGSSKSDSAQGAPATSSAPAPAATDSAVPAATAAPEPTSTAAAEPTAAPSYGPASKADAAAITTLAKAADTSKNLVSTCKSRFTPAFVTMAFGTLDNCVHNDDGDTNPTAGATVADVQASGDSAIAKVTDIGGHAPGATGIWHFVRSHGKWLVSDFGADYLRSGMSRIFGPSHKSTGANDPFASAPYRACVSSALQALDDEQFRKLFFASNSKHNDAFAALLADCSKSAPGGVSPFRTTFATILRTESAGKVSKDVLDCVIGKIDSSVSDTALVTALLDGTGSTSLTEFDKQVSAFTTVCAKGASKTATIRTPQRAIASRSPLH